MVKNIGFLHIPRTNDTCTYVRTLYAHTCVWMLYTVLKVTVSGTLKTLLVLIHKDGYSLVFRRKDLCDARAKPEMSSKKQMQMYPHSDIWWPRAILHEVIFTC